MIKLLCETLKRLDIEWQLSPKDLKMKCRSRIDENTLSDYEATLTTEVEKNDLYNMFLRKNYLKFYITLYKESGKSSTDEEKYMLDFHLFKGTMFVFMDFFKKLLYELT